MTEDTRIGFAAFLLCSATVFCPAVLFAANGNGASLDVGGGAARGGQWTIVATYSIPEGASGLAHDGTYLYCGIYGSNGDEVYRIDPATGNYTLLFSGPQDDAFGLTYDGQYLWTTHHPGSGSNPAIALKLDWDGSLLTQFDLPDHYMSGIAYDAGDFWVARYYSDPSHLYKVDNAGLILDDFVAPDNQPWDLCLENANLWMADYWGDALYKIDPTTGAMLESHPSEGVDPAGVVWDGQYLWYCDNGSGFDQDYLYKVDLQGLGAPVINVPVTDHDFGPITIGDSDTWLMTVQNNGVADLNITGLTFSPPNDLSAPDTFPIIISPSGSDQLSVVYAPDDFNPLDATATVASNDPINPTVDVTLTGHGVYSGPAIDVLEDMHDYGSVRTKASTRWFMEIRNQGDSLLTIDSIDIDDTHFYLDDGVSFPINLGTLASIEIGVWFNPDSATSYGATVSIYSNDASQNPAVVSCSGTGVCAEHPMGEALWSYLIDTSWDNSAKAIASLPDVNGDGVADVIVCSEDNFIRCFNGSSDGTGDILWEHEIYSGSIYSQKGLQVTVDLDGDGYSDVVVGATGGARLIRALSGKTGQTIWTHDTHEYGDGGWVYQLDCTYDYNGDGIVDVLASTGDDAGDIGPKRVYCLNGLDGVSIWETPLGGPVFAVIGVEDFNDDGQPDVVAGASNEGETEGRAYGIDGADGSIEWTFVATGSSVWALAQIDDITADGVRDVIVGDFSSGNVYGLDAKNGVQWYTSSGLGLLTRFERLDDVNGDGHPDILPAHLGTLARVIDGQTGSAVWIRALADKPSVVARIADVSGDGINDVVIGTLFNSNYVYFLDGVDGSTLEAINYGTAVDAIAAIPDIVGDGSWEMVAGGRNGLVTTYSGGLTADSCGDGCCVGDEDPCSCEGDCGAPPDAEVPGDTCADGEDNDCDGCADGSDSDCGGTETSCSNAMDDDCDGQSDCDDPDCVLDPACIVCDEDSDCDDGDACTLDECNEPMPPGACKFTYKPRPFGDVTPFAPIVPPCPADPQGALGDGFANMLDVFCAFNAFNEGNPYTQCPCADVAPCGGDTFVNMQDVFSIFNAFNDSPACPAPCP